MKKYGIKILSLLLAVLMLCSCSAYTAVSENLSSAKESTSSTITIDEIPEYSSSPYVEINGNKPDFDVSKYSESFETYGDLDELGRCTVCFANISKELMPTNERGAIGSVKPTGWHTVKYDCVDGKYLYNRCHLIGYQLTAENANERNLITGTRYLNVEGMLPFEEKVAEYVKNSGNHVLYRVTPKFNDDELIARGVQIEAMSIEDNGVGICFNVYCYNVQPQIKIDYQTGDSEYIGESDSTNNNDDEKQTFIVNTSTRKFHKETCSDAKCIKAENKKTYTGYRDSLINNGYSPCSKCKP
ncbi:DNA/RNA non-specific endonuclease [Eubacterium sp.]|uniref:DNA/RNA non-specific endonuclease n=1 Tax=Eubacterium sp. TaxID=142586 RepID=UPI0039963E13